MGEQGESAGLALDVRQQRVDKAGLEPQSSGKRRAFDRSAKLFALHRAEQALVRRHGSAEPRVLRTATVEVRTKHRHHLRRTALREVDQGVEETGSSHLVGAQRECLLELIDDEQRGLVAATRTLERRDGVVPWRHDDAAPLGRERGDKPRAHE